MSKQENRNGVLLHSGKKYAVDLLWLLVNEDDGNKLAKHRVQKAKGDFFCTRSSIVNQHGIGWLNKGHRSGMIAAASIAVDQLVGEWHGVFKAENGWWYLQVHSDTIAPTGDQFFISEEDAYNAFMASAEKHNWPHSYAPKEWNHGTREVDLSELLVNSKDGAVLQATSLTSFFGSVKNLKVAAMVMLFLILGGFGYFLYPVIFPPAIPKTVSKPSVNKKNVAEVAQLPKEIKPLPDLNVPEEEEIVEMPKPSQVIDSCGQSAARLIRPIPGWPLKGMVCTATNVSVQWQQTVGSMNVARSYIVGFPSNATASIRGKDLVATMPLMRLPLIQQENWLSNEEAVFNIEQRLNNIGQLTIKPVTPKPPPPPKKGKAPPPPRPYIEINLKTTVSPKTLAGYFDMVGMEMLNIKWDIPQKTWDYQFKLTTKRKGE